MTKGIIRCGRTPSFVRADPLDREVLERLAHSIRRVLVDGGIDRVAARGELVQVDVILKAACRLVASKRFGRYLSLDDKGRPYLDKGKVKRAEHLDGKFVLTTNDDTLTVADIALGYKGMGIIENCIRKMKTTGLAVQPMFHWTPPRITAHVKRCVLALMIPRAVERRRSEMTWTKIRTALEAPKAVSDRTKKQATVQTTKPTKSATAILKKLDSTKPKTIISVG